MIRQKESHEFSKVGDLCYHAFLRQWFIALSTAQNESKLFTSIMNQFQLMAFSLWAVLEHSLVISCWPHNL